MEFITKTPQQLSTEEIASIATLAGIGFGQGDTAAMRADSIAHINGSDSLQLCHDDGTLVAFSMAKECLWRPSNRTRR